MISGDASTAAIHRSQSTSRRGTVTGLLASCLVLFGIAVTSREVVAAAPLDYTSSITRLQMNGHFVVAIQSMSHAPLACQIKYTGMNFLGMDRAGHRLIFLPALRAAEPSSVRQSLDFGGFRTFSATVTCAAPRPVSR